MYDLELLGKRAKVASATLNTLDEKVKNDALKAVANKLREKASFLIEENAFDIKNAIDKGISPAFIDRLTLNEKVIEGMAVGIEQVAELSSPLGQVLYSYENKEQGISVEKKADISQAHYYGKNMN